MYDWLKGARRVAAAVSGKPDCVPIYGPLPDHALHLAGIPSEKFYTDAELFTQTQLLLAEYYGFDLPYLEGDVHNIEAEALGRRIVFRDRVAPLLDPTDVLIRTSADLARIQTPDFLTAGRMPFMLKTYRLIGEHTGLPALRWFTAPFSLACAVMGYSQLVLATKNNLPFVQDLMQVLIERVLTPWIRYSLQYHPAARAATGIDHWASFPIISWTMFQDFVVRSAHQLRDRFGAEGYRVVVQGGWGDSQLADPLPLFEERIRLQGALRGFDPDVYQLGPALYADVATRHNVALGLGLDSHLIHDGPVDAIVNRIKTYIRQAGSRGRLTLIINNVPGDTPVEHIHAAVAAAHLYGKYPLADDLDAVPFELPDVEPFADFARRQGWKPPQANWLTSTPVRWDALIQAIIDGDADLAAAEAERCLRAGIPAQEVFDHAVVRGIQEAGRLWDARIYAVPDVLLSAESFKAAVKVVEQYLTTPLQGKRGKVVIGIVEGDVHDLGKSIVTTMLQGAGFTVIDLGVDVSVARFVEAVRTEAPQILGIGAYLSTTVLKIRDVIAALETADLRSGLKVMIGGGPTSQSLADHMGADAWGEDASVTVKLAQQLIIAGGHPSNDDK